jgi:hypothetical protein
LALVPTGRATVYRIGGANYSAPNPSLAMSEVNSSSPPGWFRIVAILALVWNAFGVFSYLQYVYMSDEAIAALPPEQQAMYADFPAWVTGAFAIAVFAGVIGALGLVLRKKWAMPVLALSLGAIVIQMGYSLFGSGMLEVMGPTASIFPVIVILVGGALLWLARMASQRGWLG